MFGRLASAGLSYAGQAGGYAGKGFAKGAARMGGSYTGMSAATGAVGGGLYGGTVGRDYGQSRLGGAFSGALGGAALGAGGYRYGKAGMNAKYAKMATASFGRTGFNKVANMRQLRVGGKAAGRAAWGKVKEDAIGAYSHIGKTLKGNGAFNGVKSTLKAGYDKRRY